MKPDAQLRMEVFQEGQRAYAPRRMNPYPTTSWKHSTWFKGWAAAKAYRDEQIAKAKAAALPADSGEVTLTRADAREVYSALCEVQLELNGNPKFRASLPGVFMDNLSAAMQSMWYALGHSTKP